MPCGSSHVASTTSPSHCAACLQQSLVLAPKSSMPAMLCRYAACCHTHQRKCVPQSSQMCSPAVAPRLQLLRVVSSIVPKPLTWRSQRSYLLALAADAMPPASPEDTTTTVKVQPPHYTHRQPDNPANFVRHGLPGLWIHTRTAAQREPVGACAHAWHLPNRQGDDAGRRTAHSRFERTMPGSRAHCCLRSLCQRTPFQCLASHVPLTAPRAVPSPQTLPWTWTAATLAYLTPRSKSHCRY